MPLWGGPDSFPAIGTGIGTRWRKAKDDGGDGEWLIEAKGRECGRKGLGRNTRKPWALYLYPGRRPIGGFGEEASKVFAFNALT
jgi:hypothetical protein